MRTLLLMTTAAVALLPQVAAAQVETTANPAPSAAVGAVGAPDQNGLADIVVTAQRRLESSAARRDRRQRLQGGALLASPA